MTNKIKGQVPLKLSDGREFVVVLDMEAMLSVEDVCGKPLPKVLVEASEGFMSAIAAVAQAAFSRHHPDVTRADVLDIMVSDRDALTAALGNATEAAFPKERPGNAKAPKPAPRGKSSGRSGAK